MVFIEEISYALKELIESVVTCKKNGNEIIPKLFSETDFEEYDAYDRYIPLYATTPQKELSEEQVPAIIFRCYDIKKSDKRLDNETNYEYDGNKENKGLAVRKGEPVDLYFQIDFFSDYYFQMVQMETSWRKNVKWNSSLKLPDGTSTSMTQVEYQVLDQANTERFFRRSFSYRIWGRLDDEVQEVHIFTTPKVKTIV